VTGVGIMTTRLLIVVARLVARPSHSSVWLTAAVSIISAGSMPGSSAPTPPARDGCVATVLVGAFWMAGRLSGGAAPSRDAQLTGRLFGPGTPRRRKAARQWGSARALESPSGFILGRGISRLASHGAVHRRRTHPDAGADRRGQGCELRDPELADYPGSALVIDPRERTTP